MALTGGLALIGWWLDIAALKSVLPGLVTIQAVLAVLIGWDVRAVWGAGALWDGVGDE